MNSKMKILVADDVTVFGKDCKKELEKSGFEVSLCKKDGNTVISLLEKDMGMDIVTIREQNKQNKENDEE